MALQDYKCPCCGGAIAFDSEAQKLKCPFCDTEFDVESLASYDEVLQKDSDTDDIAWSSKKQDWLPGETEGMRVYLCKSCGGEIIGDENTAATSCPYCGNPVVMMGQFAGDLKPDYIIPFKLDKNAAKEAYRKHIEGKKLLPKVFKDENHIDEIKGIYVPFWLFGGDANGSFRYKATNVRTWSDSNYIYTETSHYSVYRSGALCFEHLPVDGSTAMADDLMESIEPFDFSEAVDFQTAYMAGYLADKYDVSAEDSVERANERVKNSTCRMLQSTVSGYSSITPESGNVSLQNGVTSYAMYPVWILNTTWNDQKYTFAMNGQTGKMVGNLPIDKGISRRYFWGTAIGVTAGITLLSFLISLL